MGSRSLWVMLVLGVGGTFILPGATEAQSVGVAVERHGFGQEELPDAWMTTLALTPPWPHTKVTLGFGSGEGERFDRLCGGFFWDPALPCSAEHIAIRSRVTFISVSIPSTPRLAYGLEVSWAPSASVAFARYQRKGAETGNTDGEGRAYVGPGLQATLRLARPRGSHLNVFATPSSELLFPLGVCRDCTDMTSPLTHAIPRFGLGLGVEWRW